MQLSSALYAVAYAPDFMGHVKHFIRGVRRAKIDGRYHTIVSRQVVCMYGPYPTIIGWVCRNAEGKLYRVVSA